MWWRGTWRRARHGPRRSRGWWARWWRQWRRRQTQGFLQSRFGGHVLRRRCAHDPGKGEGRPHRWTASQPGARPTCKHRAAFIAKAARSTNALRHTATTHAMTCRFVACEGARDGEDAAARSLRVVRTTSGSAMALRPALVMGRPSGDAAEAQCQRRVRRDRMRTITGAHQCRCHHSPFLGQGQDPSRMRPGSAATPATDPGIEG